MIPIPAIKYEFYILYILGMTMLLLSDYPKTVYLCALFFCEQANEQLFRCIKYKPTILFDHSYLQSTVHPIAHIRDRITTNFPLK